ncbi:hypothetical protein ND861_05145 [Leptospira sp. 2 VSF19]|uniref:Uncharacterized protein n=1 Tax=Leptospira soteropolitanensis TaxID=2950025 RepID=A0AAW5VIG5_9LEPT|nr:hypothetical protein [Leptospira soteropolitanensis]MCW7492038.1 hypothetical protein [Leptospira soteropolitanensis]MCW7499620.1 hypothetical protein [Leptospira soteropolitanensis]MCW7521871.1 hypothetical protein [Leptospira soteropolitanensis]MCW7525725.1 hypothetical protein [Leptospira soteropolitanensis]MCW7530161.1 hypothetical protein [Leptospira soteropolitanensis]
MTNSILSKIINLIQFIKESLLFVPELALAWWDLTKRIFLSLYRYWMGKLFFDKIFFIFLFSQLIFSVLPWFSYEIRFFENTESISLGPKLNSVFILLALLNFFFLGFWKSSWTRVWFFTCQIGSIVFVIWGYLDPKRYFYDFVKPEEVGLGLPFYLFLGSVIGAFLFGYLTFKKEDEDLSRT